MTATWRATQKANRRAELMATAARLFAARGFSAVTTAEIGDSVGLSGPALYRHFPSKDGLLAAILLDTSQRLLDGGRSIVTDAGGDGAAGGGGPDPAGSHADDPADDPAEILRRLVGFHLEFATTDPDVIRVQDRELASLPPEDNQTVRRLQREYVQLWDAVLARVRPELDDGERQVRLLGTFGLLNSTPHSATRTSVAAAAPQDSRAGEVLAGMALRSLTGAGTAGRVPAGASGAQP